MSRENAVVALILLLALILRIASLDYLDATDNYNNLAYKNLFENGLSFYSYSVITTGFTMYVVDLLGFTTETLRIPSIIYSLITVIFVYLAARKLGKHVALLSVFLFAISPWSIALSRLTRDYAFDCMIGALVLWMTMCILDVMEKRNLYGLVTDLVKVIVIAVAVFILCRFNDRPQTLITIIYALVAVAWLAYSILELLQVPRWARITLVGCGCLLLILVLYFIEYDKFKGGFVFNKYYLKVFFDPYTESPWQWFHESIIPGMRYYFFLLFMSPLVLLVSGHSRQKHLVLFLYTCFIAGLGLFVFKFVSHILYLPSRYVYYLFPVYVIITALGLITVARLISDRSLLQGTAIGLMVLSLLNPFALIYAVFPHMAYADGKMSPLQIDNIGVGRFRMNDVVDYLEHELDWSNDKVYVFGGRYAEFALLLNYKMDPERYLVRTVVVPVHRVRGSRPYDVGKNMYVESSYFNYHELGKAVKLYKHGFYVTEDREITDESGREMIRLPDSDFVYDGQLFAFLKEINGFKIYTWSRTGDEDIAE